MDQISRLVDRLTDRLTDWIRVYEDSFSDDFCDRCVACVDRGEQTVPYDLAWRRGAAYPLNADADLLTEFTRGVAALLARYKAETATIDSLATTAHIESPNVFKYSVVPEGEPPHHFTRHADDWNEESATRQISVITYLNDVVDGGETNFTDIGRKVRPKKRRTLLFPSSFLFMHSGEPPISGPKYIIVSWLHFGQRHAYQTYSLYAGR